jgi:hypothetical protein
MPAQVEGADMKNHSCQAVALHRIWLGFRYSAGSELGVWLCFLD